MPRRRRRTRSGATGAASPASGSGSIPLRRSARIASKKKRLDDSGPSALFATLPEQTVDCVLPYCSASALGRLSATCRALRASVETFAEREVRALVSTRTHTPGDCPHSYFCCTLAVPLDWSWAGRLGRLRSQDCVPGLDLLLYGHCSETFVNRDRSSEEVREALESYLEDKDCADESVEWVLEDSESRSSARIGGNKGPIFAVKVPGAIPSETKAALCKAIFDHTDEFCEIMGRVKLAHSLSLDTRDFLIAAVETSDGNEGTRSFRMPPLSPTAPILVFETHLLTRCCSCGEEIEDEACDSCEFQDETKTPKEFMYMPLSSNPELARLHAKEDGEKNRLEPVTFFELLAGGCRDSVVIGRAEIRYENYDNEFGTKAGPTIMKIESCHLAGCEPTHVKLLDCLVEWVDLMFPRPVEIQVDSAVCQSHVPDGRRVFEDRGWRDKTREGDLVLLLGGRQNSNDDDSDGDVLSESDY